jgi:hypothetical protein
VERSHTVPQRIDGQGEDRFMWIQTLDGRQAWPDDGLSDQGRAFAIRLLSTGHESPLWSDPPPSPANPMETESAEAEVAT